MYLKKLKIGNVELENNIVLAPMAGITDLPLRLICKKYSNPGLVYTEMISSKALYYNDEKTKLLMNIEGEKRPIAFQIFGSEPEVMGEATKYICQNFKEDISGRVLILLRSTINELLLRTDAQVSPLV